MFTDQGIVWGCLFKTTFASGNCTFMGLMVPFIGSLNLCLQLIPYYDGTSFSRRNN